MFRYDLINRLIEAYGCTRYLEVGIANGECFDAVRCEHKDSVDIAGTPTHLMTSDEFFAESHKPYDLIFVDGDHSEAQARRDVDNALALITPGGTVVVHDCNPTSEAMAGDEDTGGCWMGGVYKVIADVRTSASFDVVTVDTDCGVAVIRDIGGPGFFTPLGLTYAEFDADRVSLLGLITVDEFEAML